jgi:hypothetical protein
MLAVVVGGFGPASVCKNKAKRFYFRYLSLLNMNRFWQDKNLV